MNPHNEFPEGNVTLQRPEGMSEEECNPLKVHRGIDGDGFPVVISKWEMTPEEKEEFERTGVIYLTVIGQTMPPVKMEVFSPF